MRTRIKMCGMTRPEDAKKAAELGVDAIGMMFYPGSPRYITTEQANAIVAVLPPYVSVVGVFFDEDPATVKEILEVVPLDILQFHGNETPEYCRSFHKAYYKSLRVRKIGDVTKSAEPYADAKAILIDVYTKEQPGGADKPFNWQLVPDNLRHPMIIAGGISAFNVEEAIQKTRPYAIDVSKSIESEQGVKDHQKMEELVLAVQKADKLL